MTSFPGPNLNGGEVAVQPCVGFTTTLKVLKSADKGDLHAPAVNIIVPGELLTTVANISNLLPTFNGGMDEGWISFRSTPATAALEADEFVWVVD